MMEYLRFLFGTRERAIVSSTGFLIVMLIIKFKPDFISEMVKNLLTAILTGIFTAISPFIQPILIFIIMGIGFKVLVGGFGKKKGGKGS